MKRDDLSPVHKMVLYLAHTYGAVSFGTSVQTMWVEGSGCAVVYGCGRTQSTLLRDGYLMPQAEDDRRFVLTDKALVRVRAFKFTPRLVAATQRKEAMTWLTDQQWSEVEKWIPVNNHGGDARMPDRTFVSAVVHVILHGLAWPQADHYGNPFVIKGRWRKWCDRGVMDNVLGHLFGADGPPHLLLTTEILMRSHYGREAIARGDLPTFEPIDEMEAA